MRVVLHGLFLASAVACGVDETVYIPDYADLYCTKTLECVDPAILTFDGIESVDDCLAVVGPEIEADVARCDYHGGQAKKCLKAMEQMGCPAEGAVFDTAIPAECALVLTDCAAAPETGSETSEPTSGGTGA